MSETLKPWYAAATHHEDIREVRLTEAVFAARTVGEPVGNGIRRTRQAGWICRGKCDDCE